MKLSSVEDYRVSKINSVYSEDQVSTLSFVF